MNVRMNAGITVRMNVLCVFILKAIKIRRRKKGSTQTANQTDNHTLRQAESRTCGQKYMQARNISAGRETQRQAGREIIEQADSQIGKQVNEHVGRQADIVQTGWRIKGRQRDRQL
jgi:hypothetical protein